jgi:hypothetical protein
MIIIREEVFKVWFNGMLIIHIHSKKNCRYCDTHCGVPESYSAPNYHVSERIRCILGGNKGGEVGHLHP